MFKTTSKTNIKGENRKTVLKILDGFKRRQESIKITKIDALNRK